jgi:hypothetical protein
VTFVEFPVATRILVEGLLVLFFCILAYKTLQAWMTGVINYWGDQFIVRRVENTQWFWIVFAAQCALNILGLWLIITKIVLHDAP